MFPFEDGVVAFGDGAVPGGRLLEPRNAGEVSFGLAPLFRLSWLAAPTPPLCGVFRPPLGFDPCGSVLDSRLVFEPLPAVGLFPATCDWPPVLLILSLVESLGEGPLRRCVEASVVLPCFVVPIDVGLDPEDSVLPMPPLPAWLGGPVG